MINSQAIVAIAALVLAMHGRRTDAWQRHRASLDLETDGNPVAHALRWHEPAAWQAAPPLTTLRWAPATHEQPDWPTINAALANSSVVLLVEFWERWAPPLQLQRTDAGAHWLVIASADYGQRAQIGDGTHAVVAWDEHGRQQRIRLQGLYLKGRVHVHSGDYIQYVDNQVIGRITHGYAHHGEQGDPGPNTGLLLLNNLIYNPERLNNGECVYIGGSENSGKKAHSNVRILSNRIYDCTECIDVKDELSEVWITDNDAFWCTGHGIVTSSSATVSRNVVASIGKSCITAWLGWGHEEERWFNVWDNACVNVKVSCFQVSGENKKYGEWQLAKGQVAGNTCFRNSRSIALFDEDSDDVTLEFAVRNNLVVQNTQPDFVGVEPTEARGNRFFDESVFLEDDLRKPNALVPKDDIEMDGTERNGTDIYLINDPKTTRVGAAEPLRAKEDDRGALLNKDAELPDIDIGGTSSTSTIAIAVTLGVVGVCCLATVAIVMKSRSSNRM